MRLRARCPSILLPLVFGLPGSLGAQARLAPPGPRFEVKFPAERSVTPLDGRLLLMLSNDTSAEPRFQIADIGETQLIYGVDVDGWAPGKLKTVDSRAFGYPYANLTDIPAGRYRVQALLNRYETFRRADGKVVSCRPTRARDSSGTANREII